MITQSMVGLEATIFVMHLAFAVRSQTSNIFEVMFVMVDDGELSTGSCVPVEITLASVLV